VVDFLGAFDQTIHGDLIVVWDGLRPHRSRMVRDFVDETGGRIQLELLPGYAPDLNPVEYLWGHWNSMSFLTSVRRILANSAITPAMHCDECVGEEHWLQLSGNKPGDLIVTILYDSQ